MNLQRCLLEDMGDIQKSYGINVSTQPIKDWALNFLSQGEINSSHPSQKNIDLISIGRHEYGFLSGANPSFLATVYNNYILPGQSSMPCQTDNYYMHKSAIISGVEPKHLGIFAKYVQDHEVGHVHEHYLFKNQKNHPLQKARMEAYADCFAISRLAKINDFDMIEKIKKFRYANFLHEEKTIQTNEEKIISSSYLVGTSLFDQIKNEKIIDPKKIANLIDSIPYEQFVKIKNFGIRETNMYDKKVEESVKDKNIGFIQQTEWLRESYQKLEQGSIQAKMIQSLGVALSLKRMNNYILNSEELSKTVIEEQMLTTAYHTIALTKKPIESYFEKYNQNNSFESVVKVFEKISGDYQNLHQGKVLWNMAKFVEIELNKIDMPIIKIENFTKKDKALF